MFYIYLNYLNMNLFYDLPKVLQDYIYSYDPTFYKVFKLHIFEQELLQKCLTYSFRLRHFEKRIFDQIYNLIYNGDIFWYENNSFTTNIHNTSSKYFCDFEDIDKYLRIEFYTFDYFITFKIMPKNCFSKNIIYHYDGIVATTKFINNCKHFHNSSQTRVGNNIISVNRHVNYTLEYTFNKKPFDRMIEPLDDLNNNDQLYDLFYIWINL